MNLSEVIHECGELAVKDRALISDIKGFVNRAQKTICQRRNWNFMHDRQQATITAGGTSANMPATFKELGTERSPVSYTNPANGLPITVTVSSRSELERLGYYRGIYFATLPASYLPIGYVFIEQNAGGVWTLNIPQQYIASSNIVFNIQAYYFPADLVLGTDHNGLTDHGDLAEALINKTKALAYFSQDPTDPRGVAALQMYEQQMRQAAYDDTRQRIAGRAMHA